MEERKNLYFINKYGEYKLITKNVTYNEATSAMMQFLESHNFKCYYYRSALQENGNIWIDFGSHVCFMEWGFVEERNGS